MKTLTLALILISMGVNAQYSNNKGKKINTPTLMAEFSQPKLYIPTAIIVSTFSVNQFIDLTYEQRTTIAITGCITSVATYLYLSNPKHKKGWIKFKNRHRHTLKFYK